MASPVPSGGQKAHGQNIQRSLEALLRICPWSELAFLSQASAWAADLFERVGICSKTPSGPRLDVCWVAAAPMAAPKSGSARASGPPAPNYHPRACNAATIWGARRAESSIRSQADSDSRPLSQTHPSVEELFPHGRSPPSMFALWSRALVGAWFPVSP